MTFPEATKLKLNPGDTISIKVQGRNHFYVGKFTRLYFNLILWTGEFGDRGEALDRVEEIVVIERNHTHVAL